MTRRQALAEARRRWQDRAVIEQRNPTSKYPNTHFVGYKNGIFAMLIGHGMSREEAFARADAVSKRSVCGNMSETKRANYDDQV